MCGINGFNWQDKELIKAMNDTLRHRGPDGEGTFFDKCLSLGHRRLAVIDLSDKAKQPMLYVHKGKKAVIVYNGEIYNFFEIKQELQKRGYKFKTHSDTEVVLASYLEWGEDCVRKFNGMWAFCIYDLKKNILFLSRDRFGKKPLYYYFNDGKFIFSSEIKGILKHNLKPKISKDAVDLYLSLGFIPAPWTIYEKISKLGASENLVFDLKKKKLKKYRYYELPNYEPIYDKKFLIEEAGKLIKNSVKLRLISDVPLGAFLSGGLDSSEIVYQMTNFVDSKNLRTYSIGFEGKYDETRYINIMKSKLKVKNFHKYFREENFRKVLDKSFYYYDEPFADTSMFPTMFLSKFARKNLIVCLSGDGGDEVFGGYPRYKIANQLRVLRKIPRFLRKILLKITTGRIKEGIALSLKNKEEFYSEARSDVYKPEITKIVLKKTLTRCLKKTRGDLLEAVRLMDIIFYTLPDNYLVKVDRASMANSLEVRCPFLDYRIVELSMKIPSRWKCSSRKNKILFKEILGEHLPRKIVKRGKVGFTPPINEWISKKIYFSDLENALKKLYTKGIIDKNWKEFYETKTLRSNDLISNNYKIRLFLLYKWYQYWFGN